MSKSFLFSCGCPRSGTTALWHLLSSDQRIRMGVERYGNRFYTKEFLTPDLFEEERFFDLREGDTFYPDLYKFNKYYEKVKDEYSDAQYFGDKIPKLYNYFDRLSRNFPDCKTIFIFRNVFDVAASYKARKLDEADNWSMGISEAIHDWNASLSSVMKYTAQEGSVLLVDYEHLFVTGSGLDPLYEYLEMDVTDAVKDCYSNLLLRSGQLEKLRPRALTALEVKEICEKADFESYRKLVAEAANV